MSEKETVMDVVNAALSGETTPEPEVPEAEAPEAEVPEAEAPEAETPETDDTEVEETEAEAEARGAERDPTTGKFVKKGEEPNKAEPEKKVEPAKKDPINDPMPAGLKKEAQERFRTLVETAKEATAKAEKVQQDFDYLIKGVEATGTSPEQYGETLSWLALFNSNNTQQQEKALELVENVAERLATLLGKERTVGDPLSAHSDLKDAVAKGQITPQYAKEIARTRNGQQFRTELTTSATQAEQQRQAAQQEEHQGRVALSQLEETLRASDPDYEAKKAILVPALKPIMDNIPWAQKKDKFLAAYKNLRLPGGTPKSVVKTPTNQPLRAGKQPAGGQTKAPGSMLEAVNGALAGMGK